MKSQLHRLRGQLFSSTQIPFCLWFLAENKHDEKIWLSRQPRSEKTIRARRMKTLFPKTNSAIVYELAFILLNFS